MLPDATAEQAVLGITAHFLQCERAARAQGAIDQDAVTQVPNAVTIELNYGLDRAMGDGNSGA